MKKSIVILITTFVLASCGVTKRDYDVRNQVNVGGDFLEKEIADKAFTQAIITKAWWSEFNDPVLDTLMEKARRHNLDINAAVANYKASRAFLKENKLDRLPTVTANGDYTRTRLGENVFVQGSNPTFSTYSASLDAFWEVDLFGRVTNRIKGAYANSNLALADMNGIYVSIFAEVANSYMELRGTQYLLDIAQRNLQGQQETYDLTVKLSEAGTSNSLDVSRALAQLERTRASIPPLEARVEALKNNLSVLIGEVPGNLDAEIASKQPLPSLPATVALGNVQEMLRRRPDVRQAEAALQVRIAAYNISVADLYPKIEFGGSVGFSAVDFSNFGEKPSFTWSLVPSISWAAFNLGRVKQQVKKNDALAIAAINQYEKAVLQGLEEIKTSLSNYTKELQRREILRISSKASAQAADFAKQRFNSGLDSFIDYLNADNTLLQAENALALSEISSATSLIAIYKALGGGWEIISAEELDSKFETMQLAKAKGD
ncbi:RND efflux system, outer membrane lipoprotein, NodT family [Allomuricauda ruestringensis DSM 13258]|uniref:RND efflux system, outer membrane lipoprotein, NodT family n=1 Tax=Allomuricauda ruestringensis (strain DSM 13258 / CIP 107369 / LMG 19739 / B1) TaxID=886377 RepID=G2PID2_ALLRU|nr:TolC family protein [Allomuricauda ruestringensis]AEM71750.1 RND efflux system, outer membrane lipoprotein, NodT family [Allomuricauda ruestringensis DSM 13258]